MKEKMETGTDLFRTEKIPKILLKIAPPVMLAQLIQAMYNIVDSFFVGQYSANSLTALSVIYPLQLIIIALAVGTGVGVNTYMARQYAQKFQQKAEEAAGTGMVLEFMTWLIFAVLAAVFMRPYVMTSAKSPEAIEDAVIYGRIVCIGSIGAFLEGNWTKVHQSRGNMRRPMIAQTVGALTNIVLDPIMIFGLGPVPQMGVAGAAYSLRSGGRGCDHGLRGSAQAAGVSENEGLHKTDLLAWIRIDFTAGHVHGVYCDLKRDPRGIFGFRGDGFRTLL